jgi:predicted TIM-barrel fold metal-dependent hydrolase
MRVVDTHTITVPDIISVDDHVLEPADLWQSRLPARYQEQGPRVVRQKLKRAGKRGRGGSFGEWIEAEDGRWCDVWLYDEVRMPLMAIYAAVGNDLKDFDAVTFDDLHPGSWRQKERLADMDTNHVEAALCFPNTLPRFCGQTFYEGSDHELGLLCIKAYNDWMLEEWGGGDGKGRLFGATLIPLWDPSAAAEEIRRCADKGSVAVTFPENPHPLGLPSIHDRDGYWNPVFAACQETGSVLCMHIGSSSKLPTTAPDSPFTVTAVLISQNAMGSFCDFIYSKTFERFPDLKVCYSEAQVGWMPYVLERADRQWARSHTGLPRKPSEYLAGRIYGAIFDDETGLKNHEAIGIDQICFETDYPHADSTFPESRETLAGLAERAGLNDEQVYKVARGNAIAAFDLARIGISR